MKSIHEEKETRTCAWCGTEFTVHRANHIYCDIPCGQEYHRLMNNPDQPLRILEYGIAQKKAFRMTVASAERLASMRRPLLELVGRDYYIVTEAGYQWYKEMTE